MDAPTREILEGVRNLLDGNEEKGPKKVLLKKTLGLDTDHIAGMVRGIDSLEIGKLKYATQGKSGVKMSYKLKFKRDGQTRYGSLRVAFHVSQEDGIEMTWMVVDKGAWKEKASLKKKLKKK